MSVCDALTANASAGAAPALRAVDCLASETTAAAFGRLFGSNGALLPALTILLTLYIAFFAFALLTGRSRIGVSSLMPRMITVGLVLTFATSWIAFQSVVWNLAVGAPDQIAGILVGGQGSATVLFADRIDIVFTAITQAGEAADAARAAVPGAPAPGATSPASLMWLAALLMMLGTVGVLVTARIALAVLLALGPVFVVFALFKGTRGLFAGWVRGVVMTGVTPLFAVLGGGFMMELAVPVVGTLLTPDGAVDGRAAVALFLIAAVHVALMIMVIKVCSTMVNGWTIFGLAGPREQDCSINTASIRQAAAAAGAEAAASAASRTTRTSRASHVVPAAEVPTLDGPGSGQKPVFSRPGVTVINNDSGTAWRSGQPQAARARGVGSRFRSPAHVSRGMMR
jgi:type IV secretion system protein VirB6